MYTQIRVLVTFFVAGKYFQIKEYSLLMNFYRKSERRREQHGMFRPRVYSHFLLYHSFSNVWKFILQAPKNPTLT